MIVRHNVRFPDVCTLLGLQGTKYLSRKNIAQLVVCTLATLHNINLKANGNLITEAVDFFGFFAILFLSFAAALSLLIRILPFVS